MKLAFIGGGVMAEAIIKGVLSASLATPDDISVGEIQKTRRELLLNNYGVNTTVNNEEAIINADFVILSIKPQTFDDVAIILNGNLKPNQTVLSIIAGLPLSSLTSALDHKDVIRAMPNTPAQIGEGISIWICSPSVTPDKQDITRNLLETLGKNIQVENEEYINVATALSGSGPAYVFLFIESLIDAGVFMGLTRNMAQSLVLQTVIGSTRLTQESGKHTTVLKDMVTSPGGTTAEALLALEEGGFKSIIINAVFAAYEKSQELG